MSKRICGVYKINNLLTLDFYVGASVNVKNRWSQHKYLLRKGSHSNAHLQNAWNKYGEENFVFEILETSNKKDVYDLEQIYLDELEPSYNISKIAQRPSSQKGIPLSEEHKRKISEAHMGKIIPQSARDKMSESHTGKKLSKEHAQKIADGNRGKKHSKESIEKMAKAKRGKPRSEETKKKLSKALMGREIPKETRKKMSDSRKGMKMSKKSKDKISVSNRGEKCASSVLAESEALEIRDIWETGKYTQNEIAEMYGVSRSGISAIVTRRSWKHI